MGCAVITGASSGIGETLAEVMAEHGRDLVLVARSVDKLNRIARRLEQTHGIRAEVVPLDLAQDARAVAERGYAALMAGKPVAYHSMATCLMNISSRLVPRSMAARFAERIDGKPRNGSTRRGGAR